MMLNNFKTIESILINYEPIIGKDFMVYKNHIYRIFNSCLLLDVNKENVEKYSIAAVFHDLGIWTHNFNYINTSITLAADYLKKNDKENWLDEISLMIENHHKISKYKGKYNTVETFRKADWIDVTNQLKSYGLSKQDYKIIKSSFSNKGFHFFLLKQWFTWFLKHPFNSLPMFKW